MRRRKAPSRSASAYKMRRSPVKVANPNAGVEVRHAKSSRCYHAVARKHVPPSMDRLRIICPNGHLGFAPQPDCIAADSGSDDVGPVPLGTDTSTSPLAWQTQDLEHMLLAARRLGVPMIIGSSGDTGSNSRVDLYVRIIRELAAKHRLSRFN